MTSINEENYVLAFAKEALDEKLSSDEKSKFDSLLKKKEKSDDFENYQKALGQLQLSIQALYVDESTANRIRSFVVDPDVAESEASETLDKISFLERLLNLKNRIIIIILACLLIYGLINFLNQEEAPKLNNILQTLHYESLAMEGYPDERLDLPTDDFTEIRNYFDSYKGLNFKPHAFKKAPEGWTAEGATVVDYSVQKVSVVQFKNEEGNKLFHYSLIAQLSDLPKTQQGSISSPSGEFTYYAFESENYNIIAWESDTNRLSFLVGTLGGEELANIAAASN